MAHSYKDLFTGAVVGGALGAMATVWLKTSEGKKFQKVLMHKYHELKEAGLKVTHVRGKHKATKKRHKSKHHHSGRKAA